MGTPYLSEVRIMSFNFAPKGWAMCNGQFLPINQNQALFSLLGTMYGGNGQTTFALPNLQGRVPIHMGAGYIEGQAGGEMVHTIKTGEMPTHNHVLSASSSQGDNPNSTGAVLGSPLNLSYRPLPDNALVAMSPASIGSVGGGQPHDNMQPFLVLNFCIALQGAFPSRN
ncbi:MAG: tail fiber protein [Chloroflexia bacterium]